MLGKLKKYARKYKNTILFPNPTIVRPEVFHGDAAPSQPMDQELVAEHLYTVGEEDYYKLEAAQEGKPWYLPDREDFLAYADSSYTKKTPQLLELADALQRTQRKLHCPPMEIAEEIEMYLRMDSSLQSIVERVSGWASASRTSRSFVNFSSFCWKSATIPAVTAIGGTHRQNWGCQGRVWRKYCRPSPTLPIIRIRLPIWLRC